MPAAARNGDSAGPAIITSATCPTVIINGRQAAHVTSLSNDHAPYGPPHPPHVPNPLVAGAATVISENQKQSKLGDSLSCGHAMSSGSPDVIVSDSNAATPNTDYTLSLEKATAVPFEQESNADDVGAVPDVESKTRSVTPVVKEDNSPATPPAPIPFDCASLPDPAPLDYQLSDNYTLKQFIYDAPALPGQKHKVVNGQQGFTANQIICNLQVLARTIWEPLKAQFPGAYMTCNYRVQSKRSPHAAGQAVDVQFSDLSKKNYMDRAIWIRDNLPYDQLLFEYRTNPDGSFKTCWIHISIYNGIGYPVKHPSIKVATFLNDRTHTAGKIVKLA